MPPQVRQLLPSNLLPDRMQARNDPLNRSTRPLLERKHFAPQPKKKETKLHGFNDFNSIPRQYDSLGTRMNMYGETTNGGAGGTFKFTDELRQQSHLSDSDSSNFDTPRAVRRNDLLNVKDWSWKPVPPPRVPSHGNGNKDGPFVFGVSHNNSFLPAYNTPGPVPSSKHVIAGNGVGGISPNTSQVSYIVPSNFVYFF